MAKNACSCWSPEDAKTLAKFENGRNLTIRATRRLFEKFHDQHFTGNERVLEIGCGLGFFRKNWPKKFKGEWIETDVQSAFLRGRKNTTCASAYSIPFEDESFNAVCGFASFDVLHDLKAAVKEAHRVLAKGGLFFHFIDRGPSSTVSDRWRENNGGLPCISDGVASMAPAGRNWERIKYVPQERLREFKGLVEKNPEGELSLFDRFAVELDAHRLFANDMLAAMNGLFVPESVKAGKISAVFRGEATEEQRKHDGYFAFINNGDLCEAMAGSIMQYYLRWDRNLLNLVRLLDPRNILDVYKQFFYDLTKEKSIKLAEIIKPPCVEFSQIYHVLGRKTE